MSGEPKPEDAPRRTERPEAAQRLAGAAGQADNSFGDTGSAASSDESPSGNVSRYEEFRYSHERLEMLPFGNPEVLEACDRYLDGGANRLVEWIEREQKHRHKIAEGRLSMDGVAEHGERRLKFSGQMVGTICVLAALLVAGVVASLEQYSHALYLFLTVAVLVGALFFTDRAATVLLAVFLRRKIITDAEDEEEGEEE